MKKARNAKPYPICGPFSVEIAPGAIIDVPDNFVFNDALVPAEESASSGKKTTTKKTRKKPVYIKK